MENLLEGVRVLDFGRYVAGPYCATLLGYLGADVIRVEKASGGEDRYIAPFEGTETGGLFMQTGCNKRSLALDFRNPATGQVIERLIQSADVLVVNLPSAGLKRMGLDWETVHAINPRLVMANQTAFGNSGPLAERGGFDGVAQAMSGAMFMTGTPGKPVKSAAPYVDFSTAVFSAFGVMSALYARRDSGEGQLVEANLLATAMAAFGSHLTEQGALGLDRPPTGNRVQTSAPSDVFPTRDGHVLTHVVGQGLFKRCAGLLGHPEWLDDPELASDQGRGDHRDRLCVAMAEWCLERDTETAMAELQAAGIPAGEVLNLGEALSHPQVEAMDMFRSMGFPGFDGEAPVADLPLQFSSGQAGIRQRPPTLGEHNREILEELGFSAEDIEQIS